MKGLLLLGLSASLVVAGSQGAHDKDALHRRAPGWIKRKAAILEKRALGTASILVVGDGKAAAALAPVAVPNTTHANATVPAAKVAAPAAAANFIQGAATLVHYPAGHGQCNVVYANTGTPMMNIPANIWGKSPTTSPYCGQNVYVRARGNGQYTMAKVASWQNSGNAALNQAAFTALKASTAVPIAIEYYFVGASGTVKNVPAGLLSAAVPAKAVVPANTTVPTTTTSNPAALAAQSSAVAALAKAKAAAAAAAAAKAASLSSAAAASSASASSAAAKAAASKQAAAQAASAQAAQASQSSAAAAASASASAKAAKKAAKIAAQQAADQAQQEADAAAASASAKAAKKAAQQASDNSNNGGDNGNNGNNGGGGGGGQVYTGGFATFYEQNGNAGACGNYNSDGSKIIAIDSAMYNGGANCGRSITITRTDNGNTVTATVQDECPTCENGTSLDLSHGAFLDSGFATAEEGMVPIKWHFN